MATASAYLELQRGLVSCQQGCSLHWRQGWRLQKLLQGGVEEAELRYPYLRLLREESLQHPSLRERACWVAAQASVLFYPV